MKQEKQQEIALMRYGAIAPIIAGLDERYPNKTAFYAEISAKGLMGPDGKLHHYACLLYTSASFDWIMKDANIAKILDGNYDNKQKEVNKSLHPEYDDFL